MWLALHHLKVGSTQPSGLLSCACVCMCVCLLSLSLPSSSHMHTAVIGPSRYEVVHEVIQVSGLTVAICSVAGKHL